MSLRRFILAASVYPFRPQTRALLERMSVQPTQARARLIDRTIGALIRAGIWEQSELIYFPAAHTEQAARLNWKADAFNLTVFSGTPGFQQDGGYQGGGILNTGWSPVTHAAKWALGDAALSAWADNTGDGPFLVGPGAQNVVSPLGTGSSAGQTVVGINQVTANAITPPADPMTGLLSAIRYDGDAEVYFNGSFASLIGGVETGLGGTAVTLLNGSPSRLRFMSAGAGRTAAQEAELYTLVSGYLAGL